MSRGAIVGTGVALLVAALAAVEWVAEHRQPAGTLMRSAEAPDLGLPTVPESDADTPAASPRLTR
jgi:hypothetical protein